MDLVAGFQRKNGLNAELVQSESTIRESTAHVADQEYHEEKEEVGTADYCKQTRRPHYCQSTHNFF